MPGIVGIRFNDKGETLRCDPQDLSLQVGDRVIVETDIGHEMGVIVQSRRPRLEAEEAEDFFKVIRKADADDLAQYEAKQKEEEEAFNICRELIDQHELEMFLVAAEYTHDKRKLIFYFTADGRVDFRELVRDLAARFRVRIELRQIGVRDDAKMNGGMGICGRELCCSSWMRKFTPVSIRMAKQQNISMNPSKVSGNCGRLLCCLNYENDAYKANRRLVPKQGSMVELPDGTEAKVMQCDILNLRLTVMPKQADGSWGTSYTIDAEDVGWGELRRKGGGEDGRPKAKKDKPDGGRNEGGEDAKGASRNKAQARGPRQAKPRRAGRKKGEAKAEDKDKDKVRARPSRQRGGRRSKNKNKKGGRKPRYIIKPHDKKNK